jgi:hypothetical protein
MEGVRRQSWDLPGIPFFIPQAGRAYFNRPCRVNKGKTPQTSERCAWLGLLLFS